MPILQAEPCIFPADLLSAESSPVTADRRWFALQTKPRQEKAIVRELIASRVPCYLPLHSHSHLARGARTTSLLPLFSNYVFLYGNPDERLRALKTNRVVNVLIVDDQRRIRRELTQIFRLIAANKPLTVESRLRPGRRVRIKAGAMRGLEGTLVSRRGVERVIVAIDFLQQGASIAVDDFLIEAID